MKVASSNNFMQVKMAYSQNGNFESNKGSISDLTRQIDKIEISSTSKELSRYMAKVKETQHNDSQRVEEIKKSFESGTYSISSDKIATAMMKRLKGE